MTVRVASAKDIDQLTEVHIASWKSAYAGLMPKSILDNLDRDARRVMWTNAIAEQPSETAVSTNSDHVTGFANFGKYRDNEDVDHCGEIRAIYVLERYWRNGVGSKLLEYAMVSLGRDYQEAVLWVLDSNMRAIEFYQRHGFFRDGAVKTELISGVALNEIRLSRTINS
ncbi:MAG: GNAT family N-acetyltransferase [Pseudohongiellaceae bacterium]